MAKICGFELKAIKKTVGMEGEGFTANIYYNNKRIGSCADYADGALINVWLDDPDGISDAVMNVFKKHPKLDRSALYDANAGVEEYLKLKESNSLPMIQPENVYDAFEQLCYDLFFLKDYESDFKKSIKKGYKEIVVVNYVNLFGTPHYWDMMYQTNGSDEVFASIKEEAEKKSKLVNLYRFRSLSDFDFE